MTQKKMSRQEAIELLRREAQELEEMPCVFSEYATNAYKAKIRRNVADKLEQELKEENKTNN